MDGIDFVVKIGGTDSVVTINRIDIVINMVHADFIVKMDGIFRSSRVFMDSTSRGDIGYEKRI